MIGKKIRGTSSDFLVLNLKQVESYKTGIFKSMITILEEICKQKKINLLVSQILNSKLSEGLGKHGYTIIKEDWGSETNAVKIFDKSDGKKKKRKSKKKSKRRKSKKKSTYK